jgi:hypothetical protein
MDIKFISKAINLMIIFTRLQKFQIENELKITIAVKSILSKYLLKAGLESK